MSDTAVRQMAITALGLRPRDYTHSGTGQEGYGIEALVPEHGWLTLGMHGGWAVWLTAEKRNRALHQILESGDAGMLVRSKAKPGETDVTGFLWEPALWRNGVVEGSAA